jgi:hypothetical protein
MIVVAVTCHDPEIWEFIHFHVGKNKQKKNLFFFGLASVFVQNDYLIDVSICMQHCISTCAL